MRNLWLGILLAAVESLAFGQLDSDTLTLSASRALTLPPDQLALGIYVTTPASTGLDEVVAGLKSLGITAANFSNVSSSADGVGLSWLFSLAVPLSKIPATVAQLTAQKVQFYTQGSRVSAASLQAHQCSIPILMADVKDYAKKLAGAAGLVVGEVVAMSDGSGFGSVALAQAPPSRPAQSLPISLINNLLTTPRTPIQPAACSLTVKFKLLRLHY
jgi:hypothetical protein